MEGRVAREGKHSKAERRGEERRGEVKAKKANASQCQCRFTTRRLGSNRGQPGPNLGTPQAIDLLLLDAGSLHDAK
jgi:hypothetical protein